MSYTIFVSKGGRGVSIRRSTKEGALKAKSSYIKKGWHVQGPFTKSGKKAK
jgi:hypothetical protein